VVAGDNCLRLIGELRVVRDLGGSGIDGDYEVQAWRPVYSIGHATAAPARRRRVCLTELWRVEPFNDRLSPC
jgi:hypothetical protein